MSGRPTKPSYGNANAAPLGTRRPTNAAAAGSDSERSETDSSDETEDEDGEELTPVMDAAILRTLTRIRRGEGVEEGRNVFQEETAALLLSSASQPAPSSSSNGLVKKPKQTKPFLLSDFQRQALLSSADPSSSFDPSLPRPPTHAEEQEALRQETLNAFKVDYGADGDDESGGLFSVRKEGVNGEEEMEDEEYRKFLLGSGGGEEGIREALGLGKKGAAAAEEEDSGDEGDDDLGEKVEGGEEKVEGAEGEKKKRKRVKRKPKVKVPLTEEEKKQKDEEFLLDYILNRGWIDRSQDHVPTYNEITVKPKKSKKPEEENSDLSADEGGAAPDEEGFDDKAEEFETRYNFRFEEPGAAVIPTHPRALPALARRPDTARKDARELRKEKKAEEKAKREEERRKIKGEKRREMEKKLLLLGLGKDGKELTMDDLDLDADFDESAHDQKIAALFESGNDWGDDDGEKPTWDDEFGGEEGYAYGMEDGEGGEEGADGMEGGEGMDWGDGMEEEDEDAPINMDADFMDEPSTSSRKDKKKKQKKKSKKSKAEGGEDVEATEEAGEQEPEAPFVGTEEEKKKKVEEIMDEYYALDHEDMIGTLPTRFHYTKTTPQTYGLTPAEILLATDTELNTFLGVKQYAAYRSDGGAGAGRTGRDKRLWELRKALKGRTWGEETDLKKNKYGNGARGTGSNDVKVEAGKGKKRKGKKERTREKAAEGGEGGAGEEVEGSASKKRKVE